MTLIVTLSKKLSVLTVIAVMFFSYSYAAEYSFSSHDIGEYVKLITEDIDKTRQKKRQDDKNLQVIMKRLCTNVMDPSLWKVNIILPNGTGSYNAQESVFVTIACNSILSNKDDKMAKNDNFFLNDLLKHHNIRSLWLACISQDWTTQSSNPNCEIWNRNNSTDYPFIFYNLTSTILNDITNLMMSRIYGVMNNSIDNKTLNNAYAINYFNIPLFLPEQKTYPQAYKKLGEYITLGKNIQNSTTIVKVKDLDPSTLDGLKKWKLFLAYTNSQTEGIDQTIDAMATYQWIGLDILYNELFFYTLFTETYTTNLEKFWSNKDVLPQAFKNQNIDTAIFLQRTRVSSQSELLASSLQKTLRQVNNTISSFPIHIGMLMYQEDLLTMRNNLAKIYLPIHQLHYKLENIQSKE